MTYSCFQHHILLFTTVALLGFTTHLRGQAIHSCTVIPTSVQPGGAIPQEVPAGARYAVAYRPTRTSDNKWANGGTVTVRFLGGSSNLRQRVLTYAREWTEFANINLQEIPSGQADIRVAFVQNGASWSMLGNTSAGAEQAKPSMNFGWLTDQTPDYEVKRTVLHEFGHALGLLHEHQNPTGGIPWDEAAVYDHYWRTQRWDQQMTYTNVMAKVDRNKTQFSAYDRASIMHYPIDERLTGGRYSVGMNNDLSTTDKSYIAQLYPGRQSPTRPVQEPATTPSPTPAPPRPTTTPTQPRPGPVTTSPSKPVGQSSYAVSISNELGRDVKAETVHLYIGDRKYVIRLHKDRRKEQRINIDLKQGNYPYRVESKSTYFGYRNVRRGQELVRRYVERDVAGYGKGTLAVSGNKDLTLFGSYDRNRGKMRVYLAERGK